MRHVVIGVAWIAASCIALRVSAQVPEWDTYKPHALKAWKTYREQFDCVAISGEGSAAGVHKYDLYFDKASGNALFTKRIGFKGSEWVRQLILEKDRCLIIEKASEDTEFRLVSEFSSLVPEEQDDFKNYQLGIESLLFPLLLVFGSPIDEILERGEAKILAVVPDEKTPNLVTVEMEISETALGFIPNQAEHPELVNVKVVFDAERLWVIKSYETLWSSGYRFAKSNETIGFLGCAVCSRAESVSAIPDTESGSFVQIEVETRTYSIVTAELVSSKIAEARALVDK